MPIRDRIVEFLRVPASTLSPNPRNWRTHPPAQRAALLGVLGEIGYADALLARRREDGTLELIDGHLRAEVTPEQLVPVLVLDVSQAEADKLLLSLDPLAGMAGIDPQKLKSLLARVSTAHPAVQSMFAELEQTAQRHSGRGPRDEIEIPQTFGVLAQCRDEREQEQVYERLTADGIKCRLMML
jgi:hypothetical protein